MKLAVLFKESEESEVPELAELLGLYWQSAGRDTYNGRPGFFVSTHPITPDITLGTYPIWYVVQSSADKRAFLCKGLPKHPPEDGGFAKWDLSILQELGATIKHGDEIEF